VLRSGSCFQPHESFHSDRAHEPNIPALLELMKVRYTGARPDGLMLCKDKRSPRRCSPIIVCACRIFVNLARVAPIETLAALRLPGVRQPVGEESSMA